MVNYWDSSAVTALLVGEPAAARYRPYQNERIVTWWGTLVECSSAITRRQREGAAFALVAEAFRRLDAMRDGWREVEAGEGVRRHVLCLLNGYPLRAGDALQLAAACVISGFEPHSVRFLSEDARLKQAAEREGFVVD